MKALSFAVALVVALFIVNGSPASADVVTQTPTPACSAAVHDANGILWIGDSITASGYADITQRLNANGHPVCVNGEPGRQTAEAVEVLRDYIRAGLIAPTVVMAIGTNDAPLPLLMECQINNTMFAVGQSRRVYWINVYNGTDTFTLDGSRAVNNAIINQDRAHTNLAPSDWFGYVSTRPWLLQSDHVHPTGVGNSVRTVNLENDIFGTSPLWTRLPGEIPSYDYAC